MGKLLHTTVGVSCMKLLLTLFNIVFMITGVVILAVGIWMNTELYKYLELSSNYSNILAYVLIGTGTVIVLTCSLACWCTLRGQSVLLYMYAVFLTIVFVFELSAGISGYIYRGKVDEGFKLGLEKAMDSYADDAGRSKALDIMQSTLDCCGSNGYEDWFLTAWASGNHSVPESCCHKKPISTCHHLDLGTNVTDIYTKGCYNLVVDSMKDNLLVVGGTALGIAFFMLLGILISCCLGKHINKVKYEQV